MPLWDVYKRADVSTLDSMLRSGLPYVSWKSSHRHRVQNEYAQDERDEVAFALLQFASPFRQALPLLVAAWLVRMGLGCVGRTTACHTMVAGR